MTDFYNVSSKQTTYVIPDFTHQHNLRPGADTTADNKILAHNASLTMPTNSVHRIVFDFVSNGFFLQNPDAHIAVVARCDTDALAAGDPRGAGIVMGNLSGYPNGRGNPAYPSSQIEAFWAGVHPPPDTRNDLLPESSWRGTYQDNKKYRIVVDSQYKADKKSRTAYEIHKVENDGSTTELFKSGFFFDGNIWYDATKNGAVIGYVLGNSAVNAWTIDFTNVKSIIAEMPPEYLTSTTNVNGSKISITFSDALKSTATPAESFAVRMSGAPVAVSSVSVSGATVELTLSAPIVSGKIVSVAYTAPAPSAAALQTASGALIESFGSREVSNVTAEIDTAPPVAQASRVNAAGTKIIIEYNKALATPSVPASSAYEVLVNGAGNGVTGVAVVSKTVELTLSAKIAAGATVRLAYVAPSTGAIQDVSGNKAADLTVLSVPNQVYTGNPNNHAASYTKWADFESKHFDRKDQVVNTFDDFVMTSNPGALTLDATETGSYNVLPPDAIPSDASRFRLMFSFFTDDYFAKNVHSGFKVAYRFGDDMIGAIFSVNGYGGPFLDREGSEGYTSSSGLEFKIGMNPVIDDRYYQFNDPSWRERRYLWELGPGWGNSIDIFAGNRLCTVIVDCDVTNRDKTTGAIKEFQESIRLFEWVNGAPTQLKDSFIQRKVKVPDNYSVDFSRTGIKFVKEFKHAFSLFAKPEEDPNWKIEFTRIKAAWAPSGEPRPSDPGPKGNRKVKVTVSHPGVIKVAGLEKFIEQPFSEINDQWVLYTKPVQYSDNGAQVRLVKGEEYNKDPVTGKPFIAKGGEARLWRPWNHQHSRGYLFFNDLDITIEAPADSETLNKQYSTRIVMDYFDDLIPAQRRNSSIFGTYNDFENKQSEIIWYGVNARSNYYEQISEEWNVKSRIKSVTYNIGAASHGLGGFPCDEFTTVVADKLVILLKFGNITFEEYAFPRFDEVLWSKTLAEDAWVEIVIPIDLDWGREEEGGGGSGGSTAPGIPQLPPLFSGVEPPKTPEDTVDFAAQVVQGTTAAPVNTKQFAATVAAAAIMGPDAYKKSRFSIMLNAGNPLAAADALGDLQTYIDLKLDPDEKKALEEAKKLHAALAPFKDPFLQGGYLDEFGEYKDTPQSIDAMQSQPGYVARPQFLPNEPVGFQDPHKQYPKPNNKDEPDTNRIQRQERSRATQQFKKEQSRHKEVIQANGAGSWEQPTSGYNTRYPYNHATTTESGHVFEFDDTPGSERINMYHRTGTFFEIDNAGTRVRRTVGDDYTILERDGKVHIVGNADVTIGGARRVRVENTFDLEVHGATTINIFNDVNLRVSGDVRAKVSGGLHASVVGDTNVAAMGTMQLRSNGNMFLNTEGRLIVNAKGNIEMNTSGEFVSNSAGSTKIGAGGQVAIDGTATYIQSGGASGGSATVPPFKLEKDLVFNPKKVVLPPLHPHSRDQEAAAVFETPDEGSDAEVNAWKKKRLDEGTTTQLDLAKPPAKPEGDDVESPAAKGPAGAPVNVEVPTNREFRGDDKLSKYFTLADLTHNYSRKLTDRFGNTAQEKFKALSTLATNVLDVIKAKYPSMVITSGLRDFVPPGGAKKSAHLTGHAVDIQFPGLDRKGHQRRATELSQLFEYDQMLLEYTTNGNGWIHISLKPNPRGVAFTMYNHKKVPGSDGKFVVVV